MIEILVVLFILVILICIWVMLYDGHRFVVRYHTVRDQRIRKKARAVVIADLHNKQYGKDNELLLQSIREQKPDYIMIVGDILTAVPGKSMEPAISFLKQLSGAYPIYYSNGNHEHRLKLYPGTYGDMAKDYEKALMNIKVAPMINSHVELSDTGLVVYGSEIDRVYYNRLHRPDMDVSYLTETLGKTNAENYTVLLAHNPDYFPQYAAWGADLVLSGHVHGGVARIPLWGKGMISPSLRLFPRYDGGVFRERSAIMLLSRGLGAHTIPIRLFNPGEYWVVDFEPGE